MERKLFNKARVLKQSQIPVFTDDTFKQQEHTEQGFHNLSAGLKTTQDLKSQNQHCELDLTDTFPSEPTVQHLCESMSG